jgi:Ras family protein
MSTRNGLKRRKIVVLGSRSVGVFVEIFSVYVTLTLHISGKSSLILQFVENNFVENYYPTLENSLHKTVEYNGIDFECEIIDTAGQVNPCSLTDLALSTLK